jgi:hypothetical protein
MRTKKAFTNLQVILLIDIIVIAAAAGGYFYIESLPPPPAPPLDPVNVQLTDLTPDKTEALAVGDNIKFSINVTNISTETGFYTAKFLVDNQVNQEKTVDLVASETKTVEFELSNVVEGSHVAKVGNSEAPFTVLSKFRLSEMAINRTEARINEPIGIAIKITNQALEGGDYSVDLVINGATVNTKTGHLDAGASTNLLFEVVEPTEGTYNFKIGILNGTFTISPSAPAPKPAEFILTNLIIDPEATEPNKPVAISVNVQNTGELSGSYSFDFKINGVLKETKTVQLSGGEITKVDFSVTEANKAVYSVQVGTLTGQFSISSAEEVQSKLTLSNVIVNPYEVWAGDTVAITVTATNPTSESDFKSLTVKLSVDSEIVATKTVTLPGGKSGPVKFEITAGNEGLHRIKANDLGAEFKVVKTGFHTLSIASGAYKGVEFKINDVPHKTLYSELLPVGSYTVTMPGLDPTGKYTFLKWEDGGSSPQRIVTLNAQVSLSAIFTGGSSCPSLFVWNGTNYNYVQEVSNHGWLGYTRYVNEDGSLEYWRNNPWDYIPLNKNQLQSTNGAYHINLGQRWDEIFFVDAAYMMVVDHPSNQNVYSTMVEQYIDPNYMGQIYTVSKNPLEPVSAFNEIVTVVNGTITNSAEKVDALSQISKTDGVFTTRFNGKYSQAWNNQTWNRLTMNLGNLAGAQQIKLVVRSMVDWGPAESYTLWMNKFYGTQLPNHTEPTPTPIMEVKDANGNWVRVPESRQFPLPPDTLARTYVVDLTGLFPTKDYSLRISNFWNVTFDYIGIDTTPNQNVTIQKINPQAYLFQEFVSPAASTGNFTRYGNVTELLLNEDDKFVVGRQGDTISLQFPTDKLAPISEGMERDYYFFVACWFKVQYANYGFGPGNDGFTVNPLPFHNMSGFPYPLKTESYPYDAEHLSYLQEYNTREIKPSPSPSAMPNSQVAQNSALLPIQLLAVGTVVLIGVSIVQRRINLLKYYKRAT